VTTAVSPAVSPATRRIVKRAELAAYLVAATRLIALGSVGLLVAFGQPWGAINYPALLLMTVALIPLMFAFWELGGLTPTPLARLAQGAGWIAVAAWVLGESWVQGVALVYIGLWIAGANLLAGPWLGSLRWLGLLGGIGWSLIGIVLVTGGANVALATAGAIGSAILFPVWAVLMGRLLHAIGEGADSPQSALAQ
jgi:hypothetical protein